MKVCFICQYFPPEQAPIGFMVQELAEDLASKGHEVSVITGFPNHPGGRVYPGYRQSLFRKERRESFTVVRCFMWMSPRRSVLSRVLGYLTFALVSTAAALKLPRQDVLMVTSPPLTNGLIAVALSGLRRLPFVFNVQDLFPDAAINYGLISSRPLIGALRRLESAIYRKASLISVISEGFGRAIGRRGVPPDKIKLVHNWLDSRQVAPAGRDNDFSRRYRLTGKFVVLYSGTIGLISGAEMMVDCAAMLSGQRDILFLFVGEGAVRDKLMDLSRERKLGNMLFLPFQPRDVLSQVQSSSDVSVVTLKPGMGMTSVPSKVLGYMAAAKPIVASVDAESDTRLLIRRASCGVCVPPGDPSAMAEAIMSLYRDRRHGRRLGRNGRKYLQGHCERRAATGRYAGLLAMAAGAAP